MTRVINVLRISIPNWSPYSDHAADSIGFITFFYAGYFVLCTASLLFSCGPVMMMIPESFFPCFVVAFSLSLFHLISPPPPPPFPISYSPISICLTISPIYTIAQTVSK